MRRPSWKPVLMLILLVGGSLPAAEKKVPPPADLNGLAYQIELLGVKGAKPQVISFGKGTLTVSALGRLVLPYTFEHVKKKPAPKTTFSATLTVNGATIIVEGTVTGGGEIHGSIVRRKADQEASAVNFNGPTR